MYDELTAVDIQKMQEEINYRVRELRPQLIEEVQTARAFGDLSENYEYKCAKQAKNRNDSRIRYLERMIRTAKVIEVKETADAVGLFDTVTVYNEMMKKEMIVRIVTTLRQDALKGLISKESPLGAAVIGHKAGERVYVRVNDDYGYYAELWRCTVTETYKGGLAAEETEVLFLPGTVEAGGEYYLLLKERLMENLPYRLSSKHSLYEADDPAAEVFLRMTEQSE